MARVVVCTWGGARTRSRRASRRRSRSDAARGRARRGARAARARATPRNAAEVAGRHGASALLRVRDARLSGGEPDALVEAARAGLHGARAARRALPTKFRRARDCARLAGRLGAPILMNGVDAGVEDGRLRVTASAYGGDTRAVYEVSGAATTIIAVSTTAVRAEPAAAATSPTVTDLSVNSTVSPSASA